MGSGVDYLLKANMVYRNGIAFPYPLFLLNWFAFSFLPLFGIATYVLHNVMEPATNVLLHYQVKRDVFPPV